MQRTEVVVGIALSLAACAGEVADVSSPGPSESPTSWLIAPDVRAPTVLVPRAPADAPIAEVDWWRQVGSTSIDHASALAVDAAGGLVVAGELRDTVDFGGQTLSALGAGDAFVARYAADGTLSWVVGLGSRLWSANAEATDLAIGPDGLVVVTGTFEGRLEAVTPEGPAPAVDLAGATDVFVVAIDVSGNPLWAHAMGADSFDQGGGIVVDASGRVIVAAEVDYATQLDVLDRNGAVLWSRRIGHVLTSYSNIGAVQSVGVDAAGDLFVTGTFVGTASLGGPELESAGGGDVFLAKLSGVDGSHLWSQRIGSPLSVIAEIDNAWDLVVTTDGDVVVGGDFNGPVDLGAGVVTATRAAWVARYRGRDGAHVWSRVLDGEGFASIATLTTTESGDVVAAGTFTHGVSFGSSRASGDGSFLLRLAAGDGATRAASVVSAAAGGRGVRVAVAPGGGAFVSVDFYGDVEAGGELWSSRGFSDFLLGHTRVP